MWMIVRLCSKKYNFLWSEMTCSASFADQQLFSFGNHIFKTYKLIFYFLIK